jgi:LysM repeat protein
MDGTTEARKEYFNFLLLLLFFAALTAGAARLRPFLLGEKRLSQPTETPVVMMILAEEAGPSISTATSTAAAASFPGPTPLPSPTPTLVITPSPTSEPSVYVVRVGDNLFRIGQVHGVTVDDLARANGLPNCDRILVGQELIIPVTGDAATATPVRTPVARSYIVQWGDTLWGIARVFGVELGLLASVNDIDDPSRIVAGQVLEIPG